MGGLNSRRQSIMTSDETPPRMKEREKLKKIFSSRLPPTTTNTVYVSAVIFEGQLDQACLDEFTLICV
jgi:hypothetical protein